MKIKKIIALGMAAALMVGSLTACGSDNAGSNGDGSNPSGKSFVIATDKGFSPFEFEDADGNIVGIDMDILKAISEDQGFTYDLHYVGWDAAIAECQAGQSDGMIAGASITDERKESGWIFSDGYYDATQGMAVAQDSDITSIDDLKGRTVVVKNGTMSDEYATALSEEKGFSVTRVSTSPDMYQQVTGGQADACFDDTPILKYSIQAGELAMKYVDGSENDPASYGFAVFSEEKQELIDLFNAGLANIKANGEYDKIIAKYLG